MAEDTTLKEQAILNRVYDDTLKVLKVSTASSSIGTANGPLVLTYTNGNLTKMEKTISGVTYTTILTYDASNNLIGMSSWS